MIPLAGLQWITTVAATLFAGAALYISLVEHPARRACGPPMALAQFRTSYPRAARLQAPLAILGCIGATVASVGGASWQWLAAGLILGAVVPFTLGAIAPTNRRLLDPELAPDAPETHALLRRWGLLHWARTAIAIVASWWMIRLLVST